MGKSGKESESSSAGMKNNNVSNTMSSVNISTNQSGLSTPNVSNMKESKLHLSKLNSNHLVSPKSNITNTLI